MSAADLFNLLGIGGVAIGFAFRDVLQNLLAGVLILLTRPFRIGDQIRHGEQEGTVEDIWIRATVLRTYDNRRILIPNASSSRTRSRSSPPMRGAGCSSP
ncbi:mechanosensitive ion channel family protein [Siccirubricoccus deserti]